MDNKPQTTNVYILQLKPDISTESTRIESVPLQSILSLLNQEPYLEDSKTNVSPEEVLVLVDSETNNTKLTAPKSKLIQATSSNIQLCVPLKKEEYCGKIKDLKNNPATNEKRKKVQNFVHISDRKIPPRAIAVLPPDLQISKDVISPKRSLPNRVRFGPIRGISKRISHEEATMLANEAAALLKPIFLVRKDSETVEYIDVSDKDKSNWIGLLPLGNQNTANVWIYEEDNELYCVTIKSIKSREPLLLGYSKEYLEEHGLPTIQPTLDLNEEWIVGMRQWWCHECHRALPSVTLLQRHIDVHHKVHRAPRRKYRCQCTRSFTTPFTLKRHARRCTKNTEKPVSPINAEPALDVTPENIQNDVDKIPSDESLQNYTNPLDFSTNLFDSYRISGLDISGNSRSENEFSLDTLSFKDDNSVSNELNTERSNKEDPKRHVSKINDAKKEAVVILCPYCNNLVVRDKLRQHARVCSARRVVCQCGRVFYSKERLANHIYYAHRSEITEAKTTTNTPSDTNDHTYKCSDCQHSFKRRGMLVNHMWRVHKKARVTVPLQRRVKSYPCGTCPKIYRTAAKRDVHIRNHHPGADKERVKAIECGKRECEPAECLGCPRQYATRAKMLQHMRARHPHLAPPLKMKKTTI